MKQLILQIIFTLIAFFTPKIFASSQIELSLAEDIQVKDLVKNSVTEFKAGENQIIEFNSPLLVTSTNRIPVIIVPSISQKNQIKIEAPLVSEILGTAKQHQVSELLNEVFPQVVTIQNQIKSRQLTQALKELDQLQTLYPEIYFLDFLKASALFLQGKKDEARILTEKAIKNHPNYQEGVDFLKSLKGKK